MFGTSHTPRVRTALGASILAATALLSTAACSSSSSSTETSQQIPANATIIDVRTPAEYNSGHLEGAQNIDVQSSSFATQIQQLPKDGTYVVYCRSGNRSADAVSEMKAMGFTNLIDAGSVQNASRETGKPIVS